MLRRRNHHLRVGDRVRLSGSRTRIGVGTVTRLKAPDHYVVQFDGLIQESGWIDGRNLTKITGAAMARKNGEGGAMGVIGHAPLRKARKNTAYKVKSRTKRPKRGVAKKIPGMVVKVKPWAEFYYGSDVPKGVLRDQFDYIDEPLYDQHFMRDGANWYHLDEFMRVDPESALGKAGWHGMAGQSATSGMLVRVDNRGEKYQLAYAYSSDTAKTTVKRKAPVSYEKGLGQYPWSRGTYGR